MQGICTFTQVWFLGLYTSDFSQAKKKVEQVQKYPDHPVQILLENQLMFACCFCIGYFVISLKSFYSELMTAAVFS